jgi:hypothetical protein
MPCWSGKQAHRAPAALGADRPDHGQTWVCGLAGQAGAGGWQSGARVGTGLTPPPPTGTDAAGRAPQRQVICRQMQPADAPSRCCPCRPAPRRPRHRRCPLAFGGRRSRRRPGVRPPPPSRPGRTPPPPPLPAAPPPVPPDCPAAPPPGAPPNSGGRAAAPPVPLSIGWRLASSAAASDRARVAARRTSGEGTARATWEPPDACRRGGGRYMDTTEDSATETPQTMAGYRLALSNVAPTLAGHA